MENQDVIIVGSGIAALQLASQLHTHKSVTLLTKSTLKHANSYLAQGGIAAAVNTTDTPEKHIADTCAAGRFHNHPSTVQAILKEAPKLIKTLAQHPRLLNRTSSGALQLGLEGAHHEQRIVHSGGDATGKHVMKYLINRLPDHIHIIEHAFVYELIIDQDTKQCIGIKMRDNDGVCHSIYAGAIVLATGGCGQLYPYTSNAQVATGDGIATAYLAGAEIADMEFIQFHPTMLYHNGEGKGLISEAVRGEGGILITDDGTPIMRDVHPLNDLAPRHIVAQTMLKFVENGHDLFLDITHVKNFRTRFPTITTQCEKYGIDLAKGKIPVRPGSHFLMGGIKVDLIGRSSLSGLFAIGEVACTGLHGANRLASNSLLEGLYQGKELAQYLNCHDTKTHLSPSRQHLASGPATYPNRNLTLNRHTLKERMMKQVGITRNEAQLVDQKKWLCEQMSLFNTADLDDYTTTDIAIIFMTINAYLITEAALTRTESRGGHFRQDYPTEDDQSWRQRTIIQTRKEGIIINVERTETAQLNGAILH